MANVFMLDMEVEFPDIFGLVTDLPPWKLCSLVSRELGIELQHHDVTPNAGDPIEVVVDNNTYSFEKFYCPTESLEKVFHLIQNVIKVPVSQSNRNQSESETLFNLEIPEFVEEYILSEWKHANFIVYIEELDIDFIGEKLKNIPGIRMVLRAPINKFKNYSKIL